MNISIISLKTAVPETYLEIQIVGHTHRCLLDTGCDHSIIPSRLVPTVILEPTIAYFLAANGTKINILGHVTLRFSVQGMPLTADLLVSEDVDVFMLGYDWLKKQGAIWNFHDKTLTLHGRVVPVLKRYDTVYNRLSDTTQSTMDTNTNLICDICGVPQKNRSTYRYHLLVAHRQPLPRVYDQPVDMLPKDYEQAIRQIKKNQTSGWNRRQARRVATGLANTTDTYTPRVRKRNRNRASRNRSPRPRGDARAPLGPPTHSLTSCSPTYLLAEYTSGGEPLGVTRELTSDSSTSMCPVTSVAMMALGEPTSVTQIDRGTTMYTCVRGVPAGLDASPFVMYQTKSKSRSSVQCQTEAHEPQREPSIHPSEVHTHPRTTSSSLNALPTRLDTILLVNPTRLLKKKRAIVALMSKLLQRSTVPLGAVAFGIPVPRNAPQAPGPSSSGRAALPGSSGDRGGPST